MHSETIRQPATISEAELLGIVDRLNADPKIHGILVQLPLPKHIDSEKVLFRIDPAKDVDAFHPVNVGRLVTGTARPFVPPRRTACSRCWSATGSRPRAARGDRGAVEHRRQADGEPADPAGPGGDATVTVCHSKTRDLPAVTRSADILIAAIGKAEFVTADMVREGAVVIDVGINRVDDASQAKGYRLVGDVAYGPVAEKASWIYRCRAAWDR